jgi:inhibitor of cysteine peptidase
MARRGAEQFAAGELKQPGGTWVKRRWLLAIIALIAISAAAGCKADVEDILIRDAPIHEVRINIAESFPPQVFVYIKGGLSDGCTTFNGTTVTRQGNTIDINVTTARPKDAICTQVYGFFEKTVGLGSDFISGESYIINVNDFTETFVMQ